MLNPSVLPLACATFSNHVERGIESALEAEAEAEVEDGVGSSLDRFFRSRLRVFSETPALADPADGITPSPGAGADGPEGAEGEGSRFRFFNFGSSPFGVVLVVTGVGADVAAGAETEGEPDCAASAANSDSVFRFFVDEFALEPVPPLSPFFFFFFFFSASSPPVPFVMAPAIAVGAACSFPFPADFGSDADAPATSSGTGVPFTGVEPHDRIPPAAVTRF